ncbi:MAG TPA: ADP-ribosylglycohydrolase family protein [Candidatus Xenobia bacterium]|nr:ADP-ribosylglycohydrolase family protein [Candidatus Xenobia bacterium]
MLAVRKEQFSGCLIGQCLGDALGFPVEGAPPEVCSEHTREMKFLLHDSSTFGQYTDDSQLAREWMQSYATLRCFDPADYADRINKIFAENRIVGRGIATDEAARRLAVGIPWDQAGTPAPSAGNGTAMRAAPVGLLFGHDPRDMIRAACDQSRITHQDRRCWAGAVAIAGAVALATRPGEVRVDNFVPQLSEWVGAVDNRFAREISNLAEWVKLPTLGAVPIIARSGAPDFVDDWKWISPYVVPSVLWSLYSFLRSPEDYWETVYTAIEVGGDVDTTAAMAGAISGAHLGLEKLPLEFARRVTDQGTWGFDELVDLSHRCHALWVRQSAA